MTNPGAPAAGYEVHVQGTVQGVGFRPWVYRVARSLDLNGSVENTDRGVRIVVFGPDDRLQALVSRLRTQAPPVASIRAVDVRAIAGGSAPEEFRIIPTKDAEAPIPSIPADLATCDACLKELFHPLNRRYRYPFINCTHCGPRFSITLDIPYDRPRTTMARFDLCEPCRREYEDPRDRRFHAQPIACPTCGPTLWFAEPDGHRVPGDPIQEASQRLRRGEVLAVKGLGGFHLACDATWDDTVETLRRRKGRDHKPFAVMVRDVAWAQRLADLSPTEVHALSSPRRPILITPLTSDLLSSAVSPGHQTVGLLLPYTPVHHLLLREVDRPLVMTSGNLSDEPIAFTNEDALARLSPMVDGFLLHDRPIANRTDDGVVAVTRDRPVVWRRARGWVPEAIPSPVRLPQPVLGVGAQLKNTFCVGVEDRLYLGPHVGDLDTVLTYESFVSGIERLENFLGVTPEVIAHDLHPDLLATRYARERSPARRIAVQHHHAHIASLVAEAGVTGPVIGVAYDGTGLGPDHGAWGGELLWVHGERFERLVTLRPLLLAGGEGAIREPWRVALALLDDAFDGAPPLERLALFDRIGPKRIQAIRGVLNARTRTISAHGLGRYFDALASLGFAEPVAKFEGDLPMRWEQAARGAAGGPYPTVIHGELSVPQMDLRPAARALVEDLIAGVPTAVIAARFHATVADVTGRALALIRSRLGALPVLLSGGCFQNVTLTEALASAIAPHQPVITHGEVPPNDGGLALGQVLVAAAHLQTEETSCA